MLVGPGPPALPWRVVAEDLARGVHHRRPVVVPVGGQPVLSQPLLRGVHVEEVADEGAPLRRVWSDMGLT